MEVNDDGSLSRRYQELYGLRFRFIGSGTCRKTTIQSILDFLAESFAVGALMLFIFGIILDLYHRFIFNMPPPTDEIKLDDRTVEWEVLGWEHKRKLSKSMQLPPDFNI